MLVKIDKIREGKRLERQVPRDRLAQVLEEASSGYGARGDADVRLDVHLDGRRVIVQGSQTSPLSGQCRRCLGAVETTSESEFTLTLIPRKDADLPGIEGDDGGDVGEGESAGSFRLDQADEDVYEGDEVDLWPLVREQILLALDDYPLCKEDCEGLCVVCGADLNAGDCGCNRTVPDPRLAKLGDIKLP